METEGGGGEGERGRWVYTERRSWVMNECIYKQIINL